MGIFYSRILTDDLNRSVLRVLSETGIVNVSDLAEQIRARNAVENIALEDVEYLVMQAAQQHGAAMEFDRLGAIVLGDGTRVEIEPRIIIKGGQSQSPAGAHTEIVQKD